LKLSDDVIEEAFTSTATTCRAIFSDELGINRDFCCVVGPNVKRPQLVISPNAFISIGLGGTDDEETKLKKSKVLAQKALQRL